MNTYLRPSLVMLALFTLLTGAIYPLLVTGIARVAFPVQAQGSLLERNGTIIGSELLGQNFSDPKYFHGRPSAAGSAGYDATSSGGSNYGPSSQALHDRIAAALPALQAENPGVPVPGDLLTASASGLDPAISPAAALFQIPRIAKARGLSERHLRQLLARYTQPRWLGVIGEPQVNVLNLNLALDALQ